MSRTNGGPRTDYQNFLSFQKNKNLNSSLFQNSICRIASNDIMYNLGYEVLTAVVMKGDEFHLLGCNVARSDGNQPMLKRKNIPVTGRGGP
jgi:hypothetical protein